MFIPKLVFDLSEKDDTSNKGPSLRKLPGSSDKEPSLRKLPEAAWEQIGKEIIEAWRNDIDLSPTVTYSIDIIDERPFQEMIKVSVREPGSPLQQALAQDVILLIGIIEGMAQSFLN